MPATATPQPSSAESWKIRDGGTVSPMPPIRRVHNLCSVRAVNEPVRQPDDLDVAAAAFRADVDLGALLASTKPYEGPDAFVIDDLTDDEWDRFVAALDE